MKFPEAKIGKPWNSQTTSLEVVEADNANENVLNASNICSSVVAVYENRGFIFMV